MMAEVDDKSEVIIDSTSDDGAAQELESSLEMKIEDLIDHYDFNQPMAPDSEGNFSCIACDKKYRSKNHLKRHISIVHLKIKKYPCVTCGKRFHSSQPLRIHQRIHTGYKPCVCEDCGKSFSDPSALRGHLRMHNKRLGIMCDICGKYMATENSLRNHKKRHEIDGHDKSTFRFQCTACSLMFCAEADLEAHLAEHQVSRGGRVYSCQDCPRSYKNFQSFQYHRRTHTGEKPFICKECGVYFRSPNLVKLHSVVHKHPDERPKYHCDECGKNFSLIKTLNFHRCTDAFPCWVCKTMFTSMIELDEHKLTHTVEELKRYLCKICGKRFSKASVLKNHKCKTLVVVEYEEQAQTASDSEPQQPHELQEYDQHEFHIDLCKFVCKENYSDGEEQDEPDMMPEVAEQSFMEYEDDDGQIDSLVEKSEEMEHDISGEDDEIHVRTPTAGDAVQNDDSMTLLVPGDKPVSESDQNGDKLKYEDDDGQIDSLVEKSEEMEHDISGEDDKIHVHPPSAIDVVPDDDDDVTLRVSDDKPTIESDPNGDQLNRDATIDDASEPAKWAISWLDQTDLNPTCLLDKTCQKCGGDLDKDLIMSDDGGSSCATHICPQMKKKNAGSRKFMPLRQTLALKSSPRKKMKGGMGKKS